MNRYLENTLFRHVVLLVALATGALLTQVVPTYEEIAALRERPATPSAAAKSRESGSGEMQRNVDRRHRRTNHTVG